MTTHTIYQDIFKEQLGTSDEQIKVVIETGDFNGDGLNDIKVTLSVDDISNSGTEDMIGVAFDIGDDSLISPLGLDIESITTDSATPNIDYTIGQDVVTGNFGAINIAGGGVDTPYDAAVQFNEGGSGDGIVQEASFLLFSSTTSLDGSSIDDILNGTDWYIRLQSTDGGSESAKTGGFILDIDAPPTQDEPAIDIETEVSIDGLDIDAPPTQDEPDIDIETEVSIDGGNTWYDADTAAEALKIFEGTKVQFRIVAQNTGNVELTNVILNDNLYDLNGADPGDTVTIASLGVGDSYTHIYTTAWEAGLHTNTASATSDRGATDSDDGNYFGTDPSLSINKVTNGADGQEILAGTDVIWTYNINNTGNVDISNVNVTDDQGVAVSYVSGDDGDNILEVGETWIYEGTGTATEGAYSNVGTVTGDYTDDNGTTESPEASDPSNYFGAAPAISIDKVTNGADGQEILADTEITWTYTVNNTGNVGLSNVSVTDDQGVAVNYVSGDTNADGILDTTETWIYEGTGIATVGAYSNLGTVTSSYTDDLGNTANPTDSDPSDYFGAAPSLLLDKVASFTPYSPECDKANVGDEITYTFSVTNDGNVAVNDVSIVDALITNGSLSITSGVDDDGDGDIDILGVGETATFTATYTVTDADGTAGQVVNNATATGGYTDSLGTVASPESSDTETVLVNRPPDAVDNSYIQTKDRTSNSGNAIADDTGEGVDSDPDGDNLTIDIANSETTSVFGGTISWNEDGSFTYTPADGFVGYDQFDYTIVDDCGGTDTATVFMEVQSQNQRSIEMDNLTAGLDDLTRQTVADGNVISGTFDISNASGEPGLKVQIISFDVNYDQKANSNGKGKWEDVDPLTHTNQFWIDTNANGLLDGDETLLEDLNSHVNHFQTQVVFDDRITIGYSSTFSDPTTGNPIEVPDPIRVNATAEIYGRDKLFGFTESFNF